MICVWIKMDDTGSKRVKITHVINPHRFWLKEINDPDPNLVNIEQEFRRYAIENKNRMCATRNGDRAAIESFVTVYMESEKKWVRAEIDVFGDTESDGDVIAWATDYGVPLKTPLDLVILLSDDLKQKCANIKTNVFPAGIYGIMPSTIIHVILLNLSSQIKF